ncbi:unnamed protein product [Fusarium graminearum]|nr:unnamed protein product [Fusarium graminearum]CAG1980374.1 unnamed protein product [Fusarium graminearum]VTO90458.1 unnamed protein product [Fusarium graminearum]
MHRSSSDSPDFLLCPFKVTADLMSIAHTLLEALSGLRKTSLRLLLQLQELSVLGVHLSGSVQ